MRDSEKRERISQAVRDYTRNVKAMETALGNLTLQIEKNQAHMDRLQQSFFEIQSHLRRDLLQVKHDIAAFGVDASLAIEFDEMLNKIDRRTPKTS